MRLLKSTLLVCIVFTLTTLSAQAQTIPVGFSNQEDYYRRQQLIDNKDSLTSFTARPFFPVSSSKNVFYPDSATKDYNNFSRGNVWKENGFSIMLLPVNIQTQFNRNSPYGWNDGAMIPAKGFQTLVNAGFYAKSGILSIQIRPEFVSAANLDFTDMNKNHYSTLVARYYDVYNNIDLPTRFGTGSYTKFYPGQSSIRLNYKGLSFGISTENLWWGPGIRNSLLMSNSAPGFAHLTLNTTRPIKTPIGSFEGQFIAGHLNNANLNPLTPGWDYFGNPLYLPKPNDWRYLSGMVVTWQPKWVRGLFIGMTRSAQSYSNDLGSIGSYLPFFSPFKNVTADQPINKRDTRSSMFARWIWPEEHAEVYFEWGTNNNTNTFRNSLLEPQDARAYIFGLRKLLPFNASRHENIMISIEATQLGGTSASKILGRSEWYVNQYIRQGYTNNGQLLGAGIGPGANLQTLDVSWVKGLKRLGFQFERYLHNDDFYYYAYADTQDWRRHWVDLSFAFNGEWNYKNLIFNAKLMAIHSQDYQWYLDPSKEVAGQTYYVDGATAFNLQIQAGLTYRF